MMYIPVALDTVSIVLCSGFVNGQKHFVMRLAIALDAWKLFFLTLSLIDFGFLCFFDGHEKSPKGLTAKFAGQLAEF